MEQNYDGYEELANAIILQAVEDYREAVNGIIQAKAQLDAFMPEYKERMAALRKPLDEIKEQTESCRVDKEMWQEKIKRLKMSVTAAKRTLRRNATAETKATAKLEKLAEAESSKPLPVRGRLSREKLEQRLREIAKSNHASAETLRTAEENRPVYEQNLLRVMHDLAALEEKRRPLDDAMVPYIQRLTGFRKAIGRHQLMKQDAEEFFRSDWFKQLSGVDGEVLLARLKQETKK